MKLRYLTAESNGAAPDSGNIILVGFMGAGKTSVARELERVAGFRAIDLDKIIADRQGMSIPEIFATLGESRFRDLETAALESLKGLRHAVIATGGGIVGRDENWGIMRAIGVTVFLEAEWERLYRRISGSPERPLATGDPLAVKELWRKRLPLYRKADFTVNTDGKNVRQTARAILEHVKVSDNE